MDTETKHAKGRKARPRSWSYAAGERGQNRVRVYAKASGRLCLLWYEEREGRQVRRTLALGHADRTQGKAQADEMAAQLRSLGAPAARTLTLRELFDIYLREKTPAKAAGTQQHDRAAIALFLECFGAQRRPVSLSRRDVDTYVRARATGALRPGRVKSPRPVGPRQVTYDLKLLKAVLTWATTVNDHSGAPLLERNPLANIKPPGPGTPSRPVLTHEEAGQLITSAKSVHRYLWLACRLMYETGHRLSSVRQLRWADIDLEGRQIRWRAETDKMGFAHATPIRDDAVEGLRAFRQHETGIGDAWVFPDPANATRPCPRGKFAKWWEAAVTAAGIERRRRLGFHSLRRLFATSLKNRSLRDIAEAGGWKSPSTVLIYVQPDQATMRDLIESRPRVAVAQ